MGADIAGHSSNNGVKDFSVASAVLALAAVREVAAPGDKSQGHNDREDGREASGE